jgi:hypothetical protein
VSLYQAISRLSESVRTEDSGHNDPCTADEPQMNPYTVKPPVQPISICFKSSRLWVSSSRVPFCSARASAESRPAVTDTPAFKYGSLLFRFHFLLVLGFRYGRGAQSRSCARVFPAERLTRFWNFARFTKATLGAHQPPRFR